MSNQPKHVLVFRFSSLGDVAMTAPVIREFLDEYPQTQVTVVSKKLHQPFFAGTERLHFYPIDLEEYKGILGLKKLAKKLKQDIQFDAIADLHNVLRTRILKLWLPSNIPVGTIGKGRTAKKKLTRKTNKDLKQLKLMVQRYADVFTDIDMPFDLHNHLQPQPRPLTAVLLQTLGQKKSNWIGIAPFAKHKTKRMPIEKAEEVIKTLSKLPNVKLMLFGGGKKEEQKLNNIADDYSNVYNIAGKLKLSDELDLISQLDVMVSMDSANMHIASLVGVPVISIWGGTHPFTGFLGYGQSITNTVQTDLDCRPCSTFGDKECWRGDYACLTSINQEEILIKVSRFLTRQS